MEANELRIGNLLEYYIGEDATEWVTTTIDLQDLKLISEEQKYFNKVHRPIPLTEEWLIRFGFEKIKNKVDIFELGRIRIWLGVGGCLVYLIDEDTTTGHYIPIDLKYVHTLQNFILALTQTELTLKDN